MHKSWREVKLPIWARMLASILGISTGIWVAGLTPRNAPIWMLIVLLVLALGLCYVIERLIDKP